MIVPAEPDRSEPLTAGGPLWTPPPGRVAASQLYGFAQRLGVGPATAPGSPYPDLQRISTDEPERFWAELWAELMSSVPLVGPALGHDASMQDATWFPDVRLNVAERILAGDSTAEGAAALDDADFLVAVDERGRRRVVTRSEARRTVAAASAALRDAGVGSGDVVAAWMPNTVETLLVMLAAASIGAVFSSCSPDFGVDGVLDRFGQVDPVALVAADGYTYGGRAHDRIGGLSQIVAALPTLRSVVVVPFLADAPDTAAVAEAFGSPVPRWDDWLAAHRDATEHYEQLSFDHPWYVLFSSGTTGAPKCIVHRAGGVLLQHLKEHRLQLDIRRGDRVAYFTTCGWMMWNWLASVPASGATAVLYDGNPAYPGPERLWRLVEEERLDLLGVSAKYLDAIERSATVPAEVADLSTLRTLASTGSPLSPESFLWVYDAVAPGVGPDGLHLASISGGTDLCGCFVCGDPTSPVFAGEIQRPALGMAVEVMDDAGSTAPDGARGELVCTQPFPSMPLGFLGDGPLGAIGPRYHAAYFERIPGVWAQGDFATRTVHGGLVIHGRSDTTLNPGGVRIGTAEIYRQVEAVPEVAEALVFGLEADRDVRIVLLVVLAPEAALTDDLVAAIRLRVRQGCTPRHVPSLVVAVDDLPRTRSGKLAELAVADRLNGREVRNTTALANPGTLDDIAAAVGGATPGG